MSTKSQSSAHSVASSAASSMTAASFAFAGKPWHRKPNKTWQSRSGSSSAGSGRSGSSSSSAARGALSRSSSVTSRRRPAEENNNNVFYDAFESQNQQRTAAARAIARAWQAKAAAKRQERLKREIVAKLQAKERRYRPQRQRNKVVNTLTAQFTGQPVQQIRADRKAVARSRWRAAINSARPSKAKLLEAVRFAYLAADSAARAQGYTSLTRLIQKNLSTLMVAYYNTFKADFVQKKARYYATLQAMRECAQYVGLAAAAPAYIATWIVLHGWSATCNKYESVQKVSTAINDRFLAGVDGAMKLVWAGLGRTAAWSLPMIFDRIVKDKLSAWVSKTNPALVRMIDVERVSAALRKHKDVVGEVLVGKDLDLLPVVLSVAAALDGCVVQALVANFMPHQQVSGDCAR